VSVLCHDQFITQWDVTTRENIDILNCSDYVKVIVCNCEIYTPPNVYCSPVVHSCTTHL